MDGGLCVSCGRVTDGCVRESQAHTHAAAAGVCMACGKRLCYMTSRRFDIFKLLLCCGPAMMGLLNLSPTSV